MGTSLEGDVLDGVECEDVEVFTDVENGDLHVEEVYATTLKQEFECMSVTIF